MNQMTITSLDDNLSAKVANMDFGNKKIIFEYCGFWFYHFGGSIQIPRDHQKGAIYGTYVGDEWFVSRDVSKLIDIVKEKNKG